MARFFDILGPARKATQPKTPFCSLRQVRPNPSLKLTRYGMQRKPSVRRLRHLRTLGLHCTPTRAA
jgi:hypothetical protein